MVSQAIQTNVRRCRGKWVLQFKVMNMPSAKEWHYESRKKRRRLEPAESIQIQVRPEWCKSKHLINGKASTKARHLLKGAPALMTTAFTETAPCEADNLATRVTHELARLEKRDWELCHCRAEWNSRRLSAPLPAFPFHVSATKRNPPGTHDFQTALLFHARCSHSAEYLYRDQARGAAPAAFGSWLPVPSTANLCAYSLSPIR